jgi:hypothetical protein
MNTKTLLIASAALALLVGIALVIVPGPATGLLGWQIGPVGLGLARLLGCALIAFGMLLYRLRKVEDPAVERAVLASLFTGHLLAAILALAGQIFIGLNPAIVALIENTTGPIPKGGGLYLVVVLVLLVLAGTYGYLHFSRRASFRKTQRSGSPA